MFDISHINESKIQITSDDSGALMDLSEHYTFYADGYKFMKNYRNKMWDGKIRIFNSRNRSLPYGLLPKTLNFAEDRGYKINLCPVIKSRKKPNVDKLDEFLSGLDLRAGGKKITLRDYQRDAFIHAITEGRSLIISPTGSGKSLIIYLCVRWFIENHDDNALIIVPTTSLVEQMTKDFEDYSSHDESFVANETIHRIYSGKEKDLSKTSTYKVELENGLILNLEHSNKVQLKDGSWKMASELNDDDEINDKWLSKLKRK